MSDKKKRPQKDGKQYETDHSYFLTEEPDTLTLLDEDMAVNASDHKGEQ